jgi:Zn-dependent M28 family amino/carboxypeptidase
MIGRIDEAHLEQPNYVYIIGSNMLSSELHAISEAVAATHAPDLKLDYTFNSKDDPQRFYYRSDHYNFAKNNIPVIFYFNGVHEDYHRPTDTPDKIDYEVLALRARLIFAAAWELANRERRPLVDKAGG